MVSRDLRPVVVEGIDPDAPWLPSTEKLAVDVEPAPTLAIVVQMGAAAELTSPGPCPPPPGRCRRTSLAEQTAMAPRCLASRWEHLGAHLDPTLSTAPSLTRADTESSSAVRRRNG